MKATHPCPPQTSLKKFLENDRRVLRFYCIWDDTNSVFGDVRHMVIHYYLSDDTIEIKESIPPNSGRESNTLFLNRCRLPKHKPKGFYGQLSMHTETEYYSERDFIIGAVLHLNGRPFVICGCDQFTKEFYREKYGLDDFDPVRLEDYEAVDEDDLKAAAAEEREVLLSLLKASGASPYADATSASQHPQNVSLVPSQAVGPKKDFRRMMAYDGVSLRYCGVLATKKQVDKDRRFVISLSVADDTISVFEPHQRNSGIIGGKFLERKKIKKPDSDSYYETADFYIGIFFLFELLILIFLIFLLLSLFLSLLS
jgi:hypothetical protein